MKTITDNPCYSRSLDLEESHFFALSKDEQFEMMLEFVRTAFLEAPASEAGDPGDDGTDDYDEPV